MAAGRGGSAAGSFPQSLPQRQSMGRSPFLALWPLQHSCGPYNAVNKGGWWKRLYNFLWKNVWKDFAFVTDSGQQQKNHLSEKQLRCVFERDYKMRSVVFSSCSLTSSLLSHFAARSFFPQNVSVCAGWCLLFPSFFSDLSPVAFTFLDIHLLGINLTINHTSLRWQTDKMTEVLPPTKPMTLWWLYWEFTKL